MNSPFAWPGGKRQLKTLLLKLIPKHSAYVEVFSGSAKLLFAKPREISKWEILNDINGDLVNFFRVAKHRAAEMAERLSQECIAAERFYELRAHKIEDELERALRFDYLAWWSFGGKGEHFAALQIKHLKNAATPVKRTLHAVRETIARTSARLEETLIENRNFTECIDRYDGPETFFYCDPPYINFSANGRYGPMKPEEQERLFDRLERIRGKFLMSHEDCKEVRALSIKHKFRMKKVRVLYTLAGASHKTANELLISNYHCMERT